MSVQIEAVLPFWLDRPDGEAVDIALEAGADVVGVAPSTAEDPRGRGVLSALAAATARTEPRPEELAS